MTDAADNADRAAAETRLDSEHSMTLARLADLRADFDGMVAASSDSNADDEHDPEGRRSRSSARSSAL